MQLPVLISRLRLTMTPSPAAGSSRDAAFLALAALLLVAAPLALSDGLRDSLAKRLVVARALIWPDLSAEAVAGQLSSIARARVDHFVPRVSYRAPVLAFYTERGFVPIWIDQGKFNDHAIAVMGYMARAEEIGLDPGAYALPPLRASSAMALAAAELRFTNAVLTYVSDVQSGRLDYRRIAPQIYLAHHSPDPSAALAMLAQSTDVEATLASFEPTRPEYKALKRELAQLRKSGKTEPVRIDSGPPLSPGSDGRRVAQLRERLNIVDDGGGAGYDQAVTDAVRAFQRERQLPATGLLDLQTLNALNGPTELDIVRANMERWRWMPRDLGRDRVVVNIPDFTMQVFEDDTLQMLAKVVVGAPSHPTPMISDAIQSLTVNPVWNVPVSIAEEEYLPLLNTDPDFFLRNHFRIVSHLDGSTQFFQEPGESNALGHVRFNFPNKFLVYQHDTPDKHLFAEERRDYSHGCIRVENPLKYAELLLRIGHTGSAFMDQPLQTFFGPEEVEIPLYRPVPIHLTYQTAFTNDAGALEFREDIYGYDTEIAEALRRDREKSAAIRLMPRLSEGQSIFARTVDRVESGAMKWVGALLSSFVPAPDGKGRSSGNEQTG